MDSYSLVYQLYLRHKCHKWFRQSKWHIYMSMVHILILIRSDHLGNHNKLHQREFLNLCMWYKHLHLCMFHKNSDIVCILQFHHRNILMDRYSFHQQV
jgi:hypothetical protein